jgi:hypothetical protein
MQPAMTEFAIIDNGVIVEFRQFEEAPSPLAGKPYRQFLPVVVTDPPFNSATQIRTGPVLTIEATRVTRVWTVTDKTAQQILDETNARRDEAASQLDQVEDVLRAVVLVIKDEINILRAQHSLAARTTAQLRTAVRNKLGQTNGP